MLSLFTRLQVRMKRKIPMKAATKDIEVNSVHGSDSAESAKKEIEFFFDSSEIVA